MNKDFTIRKTAETDFQSIDFLYQQNYKLYHANIPNDYKEPPKPTLPKGTFLNMIEDKNSLVLIAEIENKIVGVLYATIEKDTGDEWSEPYHRVSVEELSVLKKYHNRKIGSSLIKSAEKWAQKKGINDFIVLVFAFNSGAINFYQKNGFKDYSIKMTKKIKK